MSADEAIRLIRDGDCICVNSFVGIESPVELHEAIYRRYQRMQSPTHLTIISSAGFGVWDEERNAEGYIREGAVDRLICGHFGAMLSTKKILLEDRFEAYNLPLGCISHAIRAQAEHHYSKHNPYLVAFKIRRVQAGHQSADHQQQYHEQNAPVSGIGRKILPVLFTEYGNRDHHSPAAQIQGATEKRHIHQHVGNQHAVNIPVQLPHNRCQRYFSIGPFRHG